MCVCAHAGIKSQSLPAGRSPVCPSVKPGEVPLCDSCGCQGTLPSTVCCSPPIPPSFPLPLSFLPSSLLPPLLLITAASSAVSTGHRPTPWSMSCLSPTARAALTPACELRVHTDTVCVPTQCNGHALQMKSHTIMPHTVLCVSEIFVFI